jgi:hypothetical protein
LVGEFFRLRLRACKIGHSVLHFRLMCPSQGASGYWKNLLKACSFRLKAPGASTFRNESKKNGMEPASRTLPKRS